MRQTLFTLALALFGLSLAASAADFKVQPVSLDDQKAVLATVEPVKMITARARIGGTVVILKATEGMVVEAGTDLAVVVDDKLALQIKALDARRRSFWRGLRTFVTFGRGWMARENAVLAAALAMAARAA